MFDLKVFTWDARKAAANEAKHGVGFDEASSAMLDPCACVLPDPDHGRGEERFILLGMSLHTRVLVVCYCYPEEEHVIRIISARKASPGEAAGYAGQG
jgi:uncharacterized DUF497 family protein